MNLSTLIKQYFHSSNNDVTIDVFDEKNIYSVYQRVVSVLTQHIDIETTVLQAMSYCFYEILDNTLAKNLAPSSHTTMLPIISSVSWLQMME